MRIHRFPGCVLPTAAAADKPLGRENRRNRYSTGDENEIMVWTKMYQAYQTIPLSIKTLFFLTELIAEDIPGQHGEILIVMKKGRNLTLNFRVDKRCRYGRLAMHSNKLLFVLAASVMA